MEPPLDEEVVAMAPNSRSIEITAPVSVPSDESNWESSASQKLESKASSNLRFEDPVGLERSAWMRPSGVKTWVCEMVSADTTEVTPAEPMATSARVDMNMVSLSWRDNGLGIVSRGNDHTKKHPTRDSESTSAA